MWAIFTFYESFCKLEKKPFSFNASESKKITLIFLIYWATVYAEQICFRQSTPTTLSLYFPCHSSEFITLVIDTFSESEKIFWLHLDSFLKL